MYYNYLDNNLDEYINKQLRITTLYKTISILTLFCFTGITVGFHAYNVNQYVMAVSSLLFNRIILHVFKFYQYYYSMRLVIVPFLTGISISPLINLINQSVYVTITSTNIVEAGTTFVLIFYSVYYVSYLILEPEDAIKIGKIITLLSTSLYLSLIHIIFSPTNYFLVVLYLISLVLIYAVYEYLPYVYDDCLLYEDSIITEANYILINTLYYNPKQLYCQKKHKRA